MGSHMSNTPAAGSPQDLAKSNFTRQWGWFAAIGAAMVMLGIVVLCDVVAASIASVIVIGAMMFVGGIIQLAQALATMRGWRNFLFGIVGGLLYLVGGIFIMQEPVQGSVVITLVLLLAMMIGGVIRIIISLRHREMPGWWFMLIGGLISIIIGLVLYLMLPWSGLWVLGTLIGIELIVQGVSWLRFGLALRAIRADA